MNFDYLECECQCPDHTIRIYKDGKDLIIEPCLRRIGLFERICIAFRYVFDVNINRGAFDEIMLNVDEQRRLKQIMDT